MQLHYGTRATLLLLAAASAVSCVQTSEREVATIETSARPAWATPAPAAAPTTTAAGAPVEAAAELAEPGLAMAAEPDAVQTSMDVVGPGLGYFNSPEFERRFALSFLSVNDVEPQTTPDEAVELQEIIELIQKDSKRERALKKLQEAMNPTSSANYPYLIGQIHLGDERTDLAMSAYLEAVERTPNFRRAWHQIALLHYRNAVDARNEDPLEDYRECARAFGTTISLGLVDETSYGMMAVALLKSGKTMAAESAFRQAIMMNPDEKQWMMGLAQCYFQGKRFEEAVVLMDGLIADEPDNASYWLNQGNAYLGLKKPDMAGRNFQIADQLGGGTAGSTNTLADIYANGGLSDMAVPAYLKALKMDEQGTPDRGIRAAKLMTGRGDIEAAKTLLSGLESHFNEDISDANINEMLKLRAKIAVREGRDGDQIEVLREIVNRDPLDGDGMILLAQALSRAGQIDEAFLNFETASSIEGFEAEAKLEHARALVREKRFAEAVPLLKASLQLEDKETVRTYLEGVEKAAKGAIK